MSLLQSILLFTSLISVTSHVHPGVTRIGDLSCGGSEGPPFQSYHIHILFWQNNKNSTTAAEDLLAKFMQTFHLDESNACKYNPGDLSETDLCVFEVRLLNVTSLYITSLFADRLRACRSFRHS